MISLSPTLHSEFAVTAVVVLTSIFASSTALAGQNEIEGFHYATCDSARCIEAIAEKAWLSQLNGGFSAQGPSKIILRSASGKLEKELSGTDVSFSPGLDIFTMDMSGGSVAIVSLKDGSVKTLGGEPVDHNVASSTGGAK